MTLRSPETTGQPNAQYTLTVPASKHAYDIVHHAHRAQTYNDLVGNVTRLSHRDKQASDYLAHNFHIQHSVYTVTCKLRTLFTKLKTEVKVTINSMITK